MWSGRRSRGITTKPMQPRSCVPRWKRKGSRSTSLQMWTPTSRNSGADLPQGRPGLPHQLRRPRTWEPHPRRSDRRHRPLRRQSGRLLELRSGAYTASLLFFWRHGMMCVCQGCIWWCHAPELISNTFRMGHVQVARHAAHRSGDHCGS